MYPSEAEFPGKVVVVVKDYPLPVLRTDFPDPVRKHLLPGPGLAKMQFSKAVKEEAVDQRCFSFETVRKSDYREIHTFPLAPNRSKDASQSFQTG